MLSPNGPRTNSHAFKNILRIPAEKDPIFEGSRFPLISITDHISSDAGVTGDGTFFTLITKAPLGRGFESGPAPPPKSRTVDLRKNIGRMKRQRSLKGRAYRQVPLEQQTRELNLILDLKPIFRPSIKIDPLINEISHLDDAVAIETGQHSTIH